MPSGSRRRGSPRARTVRCPSARGASSQLSSIVHGGGAGDCVGQQLFKTQVPMQSIRSLRGVAALATLGVLGSVVATTGSHLRRAGTRASSEVVYLPDARVLRPLVLGYNNVLAD